MTSGLDTSGTTEAGAQLLADRMPLKPFRVLDFSQGMAGPMAGMILADYGAQVIKVEPPSGDWARDEPAFAMWNRGKQGIVLDLRLEAHQAAARRLADASDIVLEAFRPGVPDNWGLGYEAISRSNPGVVYCSISGFGPVPGLSHVKGYEGLVAAKIDRMMGLDEITGAAQGTDLNRPIYLAVPVFSYAAAQLAVQGILAALFARSRDGRGEHVKTSLLQGALATVMRRSFGNKAAPEPGHDLTYRGIKLCFLTVECSDGKYIQMCARQDEHFRNWLQALGMEGLISDPRYANGPLQIPRAEDIDELELLIRARMRTRTQAEWMHRFIYDYDVGADPFLLPQQFLSHPQLKANDLVIELGGDERRVSMLGPLAKLPECPARVQAGAPRLGEHSGAFSRRYDDGSCGQEHRERTWEQGTPVAPLAGITILEIAYFVAAPLGATILAELGARVIKVETREGDPWRRVGLEFVHMLHGKESIVLDLKDSKGKHFLDKLIARADVLLTNFRPGVPGRLGFGYEAARAINPRLVYVYAGSYGSKGPEAHRPAFHSTPNALSGGGILQAGAGNPPVDDSYPDPCAGLAVGTAIVLGLLARERTGGAQYVETNMLCSTGYAMSRYLVEGTGKNSWRLPDRGQHGTGALCRLYPCKVGWLMVEVHRESEWAALARALGRENWLMDSRFSIPAARMEHDEQLPVSTDMSASEIEANLNQLFATNVRGPFLLVAALSRMLRRPGGRIINISSLSTRTGGTRPVDVGSGPVPGHHAGYVATKGGLESLTIGLAAELAPQGITVNAVAPGYVEATEMTGSFSKERIATMLRQIPVGRPGRAEEIAATVAFLASPEAGYITGEIVMANGGWVFGG